MGEKGREVIDSIKKILNEGPKSINEVSKEAKINWRTAEDYLELLKNLNQVYEKEIKNTRTYFLRDKNNYFDLYVKSKDKKTISSIYAEIKKQCVKLYNKEPTKTHVYKVIWRVNKKLKLNLPIGWYMFGPCCVQIYKGDEEIKTKIEKKIVLEIKESAEEYCKFDNIELQKFIYEAENDLLYKLKEKLIELDKNKKQELNSLLIEMIKLVPKETVETATDFARATLMLGWEKTRHIFHDIWKFIALVGFRDSLREYYGDYAGIYLDDKTKSVELDSKIAITDLVKTYVESKYSQEKKS